MNRWILSIVIILLLIFLIVFSINVLYPTFFDDYVYKYAEDFDVDPSLIFAIIRTESKFNKNARSPKGAIGLMQVMRPTANEILKKLDLDEDIDLYDPEYNIMIGTYYIAKLLNKYEDVDKALAAYNSGMSNVNLWEEKEGDFYENIDFLETKNYITRVNRSERIYDLLLNELSLINLDLPDHLSNFRSSLINSYKEKKVVSL